MVKNVQVVLMEETQKIFQPVVVTKENSWKTKFVILVAINVQNVKTQQTNVLFVQEMDSDWTHQDVNAQLDISMTDHPPNVNPVPTDVWPVKKKPVNVLLVKTEDLQSQLATAPKDNLMMVTVHYV
jgi:hypothetical protein